MHPVPLKNLKTACSHSNLSPKAKLTSNQHLRPSPLLHAGVRLQKLCQATHFHGSVMERRGRRGSKLSSNFESFPFSPVYADRTWLKLYGPGNSDGVPHFQTTLSGFPLCFFPTWSNLARSPDDLNRSVVAARRCSSISGRPYLWDEILDTFQGHILCCC